MVSRNVAEHGFVHLTIGENVLNGFTMTNRKGDLISK